MKEVTAAGGDFMRKVSTEMVRRIWIFRRDRKHTDGRRNSKSKGTEAGKSIWEMEKSAFRSAEFTGQLIRSLNQLV